MRGRRTEQLVLASPDGKRVELATVLRNRGELTTQDVFQVSPDGAYLAYVVDQTLHVRAADGSERTLAGYEGNSVMRFSPDGKHLAATLGDSKQRVVVLELATGDTRELATFTRVLQLEWMSDGLAARTVEDGRQSAIESVPGRHAIVKLPLVGDAKTLYEAPEIAMFVAAGTGDRIVVFERQGEDTNVIAVDAASPHGHQLRVVHDWVTNAAMSLDGGRLAFTTSLALFTSSGDARPEAISDRADIRSLWFAHDGRLGYASAKSATILDGRRTHRFDSEGPIVMLRFDPLSAQALVATSTHVWDAMTSKRVAYEANLLGVDRFAGGLVLWISR